jgi:hypothetical protein
MSSLYFGFNVFCQSEVGVPEFDAVFSILYSPQLLGGKGYVSNSGTLASNRQNTASPKYNDDISLLISQHLATGCLLKVDQKEKYDKGP